MTDARISQDGLDAVVDTAPAGRVSQVGLDATVDTDPAARVSQDGLDAIVDTAPAARVSQVSADAIVDTEPSSRVSQVGFDVVTRPIIIRTPPTADLSGAGFADLVLHTLFVIDGVGDQVVTGGDTVVDAALDTVIDLAGDLLEGADNLVGATPYWT